MPHARGLAWGVLALCPLLNGQEAGDPAVAKNVSTSAKPPRQDRRIFWIIPNYRTTPASAHYEPLSAKEKFKLATTDAFDPGTFALGALFGAESQLSHANPSFGQGATGFARYFATSYADYAIGDYMTEAIYPVLLRQDPRFFRKGAGSGWSRLCYAVGQIFWTYTDRGRHQVNFSELLGNATSVAISNAYYPDTRDARDATAKWGTQIGVDMASNVLKEFWPDIRRKVFHKRDDADTIPGPGH